MKRLVLTAALLAAASACAAPAPSGNNANTNQPTANTAPAPAASPAPPPVTEADALARETQIWEALKAKNHEAFGDMLADEQVEVSGVGVRDKTGTLSDIKGFEPTEYTITEPKLVIVNKDIYVLSYRLGVKGSSEGKPLPPDAAARASTGWINRNGRWLAVFHQETMIAQPPPAPTPGATGTPPTVVASPAASPATSLAASTITDAVKQAWDALKRRDYDAFAATLADDYLFVGPYTVYTKPQLTEALKQFDASGATLSDFREVKLDNEVTLVTYKWKTPKGTPPAGNWNTAIAANRGGKWLGLFGQSSPAEK